jgi:hypothetical protein
VAPRVFFGRSDSLRLLGSDERVVRASMLAGDGSNASPAATTASPF